MTQANSSTRTIAGVAAVVGILALLLTIVDSARTGLIAQYAGTAKEMSEESDKAILTHIDRANQRVDALEKQVADMKAAMEVQAAALEPSADAEGEDGGGGE